MRSSTPLNVIWPPYGFSKPFGLALAVAGSMGLLLLRPDMPAGAVAASLFLAVMLALLVAYDVTELRLPDVLTGTLTAAGLLFHAAYSPEALGWHVAGVVAGYAALVGIDAAYRRVRGVAGMGRGDAKLLAAAGAWSGLAALPSILLAACGAALLSLAVAAAAGRSIDAHRRIPFGPFLALGLWLVWIAGPIA